MDSFAASDVSTTAIFNLFSSKMDKDATITTDEQSLTLQKITRSTDPIVLSVRNSQDSTTQKFTFSIETV